MDARDAMLADLRRGSEEAIARCRDALAATGYDAALLIGLAEAELVAGHPDPGGILARAVRANPAWVEGQSALAGVRWEAGDETGFTAEMESALAAMPQHGGLWNAYIAVLAGAGLHRRAADAAASARATGFDLPILRLIEATHAGNAGEVDRAQHLIDAVPETQPEKLSVLVRHQIRIGRLADAVAGLDRLVADAPGDMANWALAEIVWRATDDRRAAWLSLDGALVEAAQLPLGADEIERLADLLRRLHGMLAQPIGQSVRGGTQTRGRLFDRADPELRRLHGALQEAVDRYWQSLPPYDAAHPLLRHRARSPRVDGGWSVRLQGGGHHVSHIHPGGLLSSATYIGLPPMAADRQDGWLELGRPPADLNLDLPPLATIEPKTGRLALFPSFLYHGTRPFAAGERLTVAFDAA